MFSRRCFLQAGTVAAGTGFAAIRTLPHRAGDRFFFSAIDFASIDHQPQIDEGPSQAHHG